MVSNTPLGYAARWQKGQSGNPRGRPPKKTQFSRLVRQLLEGTVRVADGNGGEVEVARSELLLMQLYDKARNGDVPSARLLLGEFKKIEEAEAPDVDPEEEYFEQMREASETLDVKLDALREALEKRFAEREAAKTGAGGEESSANTDASSEPTP